MKMLALLLAIAATRSAIADDVCECTKRVSIIEIHDSGSHRQIKAWWVNAFGEWQSESTYMEQESAAHPWVCGDVIRLDVWRWGTWMRYEADAVRFVPADEPIADDGDEDT